MCVGLSRVGSEDQKIVAASLLELSQYEDMGKPLHSLIIVGKVHPLEEEYLKQFYLNKTTLSWWLINFYTLEMLVFWLLGHLLSFQASSISKIRLGLHPFKTDFGDIGKRFHGVSWHGVLIRSPKFLWTSSDHFSDNWTSWMSIHNTTKMLKLSLDHHNLFFASLSSPLCETRQDMWPGKGLTTTQPWSSFSK